MNNAYALSLPVTLTAHGPSAGAGLLARDGDFTRGGDLSDRFAHLQLEAQVRSGIYFATLAVRVEALVEDLHHHRPFATTNLNQLMRELDQLQADYVIVPNPAKKPRK